MGLFDNKKDPKKADFSNVQSGSSTAAKEPAKTTGPAGEAPAAPTPRGADFGNVKSGGTSTAPVTKPVGDGVPAPSSYVVKSGDSLSKIARRIYGDAKRWTRIYEANRQLIGDNPDLIHPGQNLVIPQD